MKAKLTATAVLNRGSMPGKILQNMVKAGEKIHYSCLMKSTRWVAIPRRSGQCIARVLDPEQNNKFADHYAEVDYAI